MKGRGGVWEGGLKGRGVERHAGKSGRYEEVEEVSWATEVPSLWEYWRSLGIIGLFRDVV